MRYYTDGLEPEAPFSFEAFVRREADGITVSLQADNPTKSDVSACFLAAAYRSGQMLAANTAAVTVRAGTAAQIPDMHLNAATADTVKGFLLDDNSRPISAARTVDLVP